MVEPAGRRAGAGHYRYGDAVHRGLNPTIAISTILIAQLLVAAAIDYFGWMGQEKMSFAWRQWAGLGLMLAGVVLMKWTK